MTDKLFVSAPSNRWSCTAVAGGKYSEPYAYMLGYYKAGKKLASLAIYERRNQDILFFPICFNYRHYVELTLKHLILSAEKYYFVLRGLEPENVKSELGRSFLFLQKKSN